MKRQRNNPFAVRLFDALDKSGMTQKQLAEIVGTTQVSISRYICGDRIPKQSVVKKLADVLGVSVSYLYGKDMKKYDIGAQEGTVDIEVVCDIVSSKIVELKNVVFEANTIIDANGHVFVRGVDVNVYTED